MKYLFYTIIAVLAAIFSSASLSFSVDSGEYEREDCVISVPLSSSCRIRSLVETTGGRRVALPCQVVPGPDGDVLYFTLNGHTPAHSVRTFRTSRRRIGDGKVMTATDTGDDVVLRSRGRDILSYRHAILKAPEGVRSVYDRGGFIHPACTPSGFVITGIRPKEHRHHLGVWNPWTRLSYDGRVYDLWNLGDSLGTVRHRSVDALYEGAVVNGFDASLDHVIFAPEGEKKVLDEHLSVRTLDTGDGYLWDYVSRIRPCAELPVTFNAHRYQGLCVRGTELWGADNVEMMTSEGLERPDIDATRADWVYLNGTVDGRTSGFLMMSCPDNHDSPQSLRIWDAQQNKGANNVFVNYCPAKFSSWELPSEGATLRYRLLIYDGAMTPERARRLWRDYSAPPKVKFR